MDETTIAFELPHARAAATDGGRPPDRISVRDYTRQVEIGAFRTERGVTQRIRFNVVLEVAHNGAAEDDDVDKVISYDTITEAKALDALWKTWGLEGKVPTVDFAKEFVVVSTAGGPNRPRV